MPDIIYIGGVYIRSSSICSLNPTADGCIVYLNNGRFHFTGADADRLVEHVDRHSQRLMPLATTQQTRRTALIEPMRPDHHG